MASSQLKQGDIRTIIADTPASGYVFDRWTGDTAYLDDPMASTAIVTMPAQDVMINASYMEIVGVEKFGFLYNGLVISDIRSISSSMSFVVPSYSNWDGLRSSLGGVGIAGGKLKKIGSASWNSPNTGATNEVGFNAVGSGQRDSSGNFVLIKNTAYYFRSDNFLPTYPYSFISLSYNSSGMFSSFTTGTINGISIRLCNPSTSLSEGSIGSYTQNDGTIIPTIVINGIEWTMNISETKYANGDWIDGFNGGVYTPIDNATWAAASTGMLCAYNDDLNNV